MITINDHNKLVETIESINGNRTTIDTNSFIKELILNDCTHVCLVAEDDSGEVQIDYYTLMSWGSLPIEEDKKFIAVNSKAGYEIIDRFLHKQTVNIIPDIWYGESGITNNYVLPENKFGDEVLKEIKFFKHDKFTPRQIKDFISIIKAKGCTHILLWDTLFQEDDKCEIFPVTFSFVHAEEGEMPDSEYYSIDSDMAKLVLSTYLVSNVYDFRKELLNFKDIEQDEEN
jgi:hypothetical protein